ncbi:glutamate synthase-related protein [Lentisphaera profundi]|uniref:Glutamate synthase-related protein n=1 Tax=Lentisphaera profundi TaxID=1658616 RepID=A0ABY7VTE4_9BACT|nr:glutamate synthase-related protein [Lentisphaera profundi]WDE97475.1 glutamate synthase-related protein [Lentisphaera profundi]
MKKQLLYDEDKYHDNCGVGFITRKDGQQSHDVLLKGHEALCVIPHRGGMSAEGIGDGAGVNIDLSLNFFRKVLEDDNIQLGNFGVANFFFPKDAQQNPKVRTLIEDVLKKYQIPILKWRDVPVNHKALNDAAVKAQLPIYQLIFGKPESCNTAFSFENLINEALTEIESTGYSDPSLNGFYPLSMSSKTIVYKGRLNSGEVVPYFRDLTDLDMAIRVFLFHTRFSTNTAPATFMAQPFRRMAHNGELNTDKKNRLSEDAIAKQKNKKIIFPKGQSDSARLDQTLQRRVIEDDMDIATAVLAMMPPAWENKHDIDPLIRDMYEYFSLYEEKNDGPAALLFSDGTKVGARLDRLGLRPLRTIETTEYVCVMSEAGQIDFPPEEVITRGRIEAGGMLYFDHETGQSYTTESIEHSLATQEDYKTLLKQRKLDLSDFDAGAEEVEQNELELYERAVAYGMNQESFRFLLDPMIQGAAEKISAMGYGVSLNVLNADEGGMSRYFSQRFAQVTNPPLDSIREKDGMTLRVSLGAKPNFSESNSKQIVIQNPFIKKSELTSIRSHKEVSTKTIDILFTPSKDHDINEANLNKSIDEVCLQVELAASAKTGIIILSDKGISKSKAAIPLLLAIASSNQHLIEKGLRFNSSLIVETGQIASSHDVATALGFGASAVCPLTIHDRAQTLMPNDVETALNNYRQAIAKSLMKIMGKFGLCTAESYIGGEIFESNYLNTDDPQLKKHFPNITSPVGGVGYSEIAASASEWHFKAFGIKDESDIPHLGLFKERQGGAGHSFGLVAVREYINMTEEEVLYSIDEELEDIFTRFELHEVFPQALSQLKLVYKRIGKDIMHESDLIAALSDIFADVELSIHQAAMRSIASILDRNLIRDSKIKDAENYTADIDEFLAEVPHPEDDPLGHLTYQKYGERQRTSDEIDSHRITQAYRQFVTNVYTERKVRPAALRDIMYFPADINKAKDANKLKAILNKQALKGNNCFLIKGLSLTKLSETQFEITMSLSSDDRISWLKDYFEERFGSLISAKINPNSLTIESSDQDITFYLNNIRTANDSIDKSRVQAAHEVTASFSSAAMSHGALVAEAHEAVSQGANIAGALSNSGEGGEKRVRYDTIKASSIKQVASGRFGVWAGYFADPSLEQVEIKIAQGAKPGEGGQLPSFKVTVMIASSRGGTPKIELVSPPPHHDTYSIEDLGQLIHDCKASRAKVIVKLVSSEGIGTIAVGVAKAGADVINVAGNTGGTGAAAVTSLKNTGRSAELGIAEVHQALALNGLRDKVILRSSNAHQTGMDVLKSAILGADSFEFGTSALMMLKCVMAKNCNIKCPAGITTNPELFQGDARALAQYFLNVAHEVRELLAYLGYEKLADVCGKTELLHLVKHDKIIGQLNFGGLLAEVDILKIEDPIYLEADFSIDDKILGKVEKELLYGKEKILLLKGSEYKLNNRNKSVGGQLSVDIERILNYRFKDSDFERAPSVVENDTGRRYLSPEALTIQTNGSAGQSYGALLNNGMLLQHFGTCNDGVGKLQSGGIITVKSPGGGSSKAGENVLIGNFALFGATGGRCYINGEAGDRFAVRNSGAMAVVEGVGDFFCEYMTSGTILNLGSFGKGWGNGMSGGNAYQYDPENKLPMLYNKDSVVINRFNGSQESDVHEKIVYYLLQEQIKFNQSEIAQAILNNWEQEKKNFFYAIPLALFETQTWECLIKNTSRKEMLEELASNYTHIQIEQIKDAYKKETRLFNGETPSLGDYNTSLIFRLISRYSIFCKASALTLEKMNKFDLALKDETLAKYIKNIIFTEDKGLMELLLKVSRDSLAQFDDELLAKSLADKRVYDYKKALYLRDVLENNSLGSYSWIMEQDLKNQEAIAARMSFLKDFAAQISLALVKDALNKETGLPLIPENVPFSEGQLKWLNGYFNGLSFGVSSSADSSPKGKELHILFGTQTGNSESLANDCTALAAQFGMLAQVHDMGNVSTDDLKAMERLIIITSTYGEGEQPDNAQALYTAMTASDAPQLEGLNFSICSLGDSSYDLFCEAGKQWDAVLEQQGATRAYDRIDCDVDFEEAFEEWVNESLPAISALGDQSAGDITGTQTVVKKDNNSFGKKKPFPAKLLKKVILTSDDSTKEVVHYEISLEGSDYDYKAGDALNVIPVNEESLVDDIIEVLAANGDEIVDLAKDGEISFREALLHKSEIKTPTKELVQTVAHNSQDKELIALLDDKEALNKFLWGRDLIDFLAHYEHGLNTQTLIPLLKKIQARAYSISSSPKKHPGEVHLTIGSVRYNSHGRTRHGVASTFLADRVQEDETDILCYMHANKAFAVPDDDTLPMIMVGPGTGIAPFRAFLEEREMRQAKGKNWLFFGDRNEANDFFYKDQLKDLQENNYLENLSLAFSRDQEEKIYVQDRMRENGAELFQWLEEGGYFFVCGDAFRMAKDVDKALHQIISEHGKVSDTEAIEYVEKLKADKRYVRDVY